MGCAAEELGFDSQKSPASRVALGARSASYPMVTEVSCLEGKVTGT
jgi:hypothetical protein